MNILLAEDEPKIRQGLRELIRDVVPSGLSIREASNGKEAFEYLRTSDSFDLVITDIRMNEMNGLELLRRTRQLYPELAFVIVSGHDEFEYAREALRYGVVDYLLKPIKRVELAGVLERLREAGEPAQAASGDAGEQEEDERHEGRLLIRKVKQLILQSLDRNISLQFIADHVYLHPKYVSDLFKRETGQNLSEYVTERRIERARHLLTETTLKVSEISVMCGLPNHKYFASLFKQHTGITPTEYRDKPS